MAPIHRRPGRGPTERAIAAKVPEPFRWWHLYAAFFVGAAFATGALLWLLRGVIDLIDTIPSVRSHSPDTDSLSDGELETIAARINPPTNCEQLGVEAFENCQKRLRDEARDVTLQKLLVWFILGIISTGAITAWVLFGR